MKRLGWQTALVWLAAGLLRAQFETAEVLGTVRDHTGSVVAKAAVTLLSQDTEIQGKVSTDENGNYDFFNVKVGRIPFRILQCSKPHKSGATRPGEHQHGVRHHPDHLSGPADSVRPETDV